MNSVNLIIPLGFMGTNCGIFELKLSHEMLEVENNRPIIQMESRQ